MQSWRIKILTYKNILKIEFFFFEICLGTASLHVIIMLPQKNLTPRTPYPELYGPKCPATK